MSDLVNMPINLKYKEKDYKIIFNNLSMILLEDLTGESFNKFSVRLGNQDIKVRDIYNLLTVGLNKYHNLEFEQVVESFDLKDMSEIMEVVLKAFKNYMPSKKK